MISLKCSAMSAERAIHLLVKVCIWMIKHCSFGKTLSKLLCKSSSCYPLLSQPVNLCFTFSILWIALMNAKKCYIFDIKMILLMDLLWIDGINSIFHSGFLDHFNVKFFFQMVAAVLEPINYCSGNVCLRDFQFNDYCCPTTSIELIRGIWQDIC